MRGSGLARHQSYYDAIAEEAGAAQVNSVDETAWYQHGA
jgi:hypothetical protein